ncbi:hypothetical protein [Devosia riboflavina]
MTTATQVAQLASPFLQHYPDFVLEKREIFWIPVRHLVVGFSYGPPHYKGHVDLYWRVKFLFSPPHFLVGIGRQIDGANGFLGEDQTLPARVLKEMERAASEVIVSGTSLDSILSVQQHINPSVGMSYPSQALMYAALGRFLEARAILEKYLDLNWADANAYGTPPSVVLGSQKWEKRQRFKVQWLENLRNLDALRVMLAEEDPAPIAALLHEWEAMTAKVLKLERCWEPSPFPFESKIAGAGSPS